MTASALVTPIALDRDTFMRRLIASLGHLNEGILGSDIAGAYITNVGLSMGAAIEAEYKRFWGIDRPFALDEYAHVIVDLKQKIQGNFSLVSKDPDKVVVRTTSCPFDEFVRQSPSLCFMTSSVFGGIAARNFGYAKVVLHKRIALGDDGCYVTVHLRRTPEAEAAIGREYVPEVEQASPDIAEQLRLMDSLRRLRHELGEVSSRWEELVRGAADAICVIAPDGRVAFTNARWRDLLGVEGDELIGGAFERIVHPDDQERVATLLASVLGGQRAISQGCRLRHRAEHWRDVAMSLGPIRDDQGQIVGTLAILRDVTDERRAERLKDDLLSIASHELRTPVTTIKAMTQLLLRTIERDGAVDPSQLARRLERIREEADRLALLGTDLVDATHVRSGRLTIHCAPHDLSSLVADAVERQRDILGTTGRHTISLAVPTEPIRVSIDRKRLDQVLGNLLDNAVKYSPDGGRIDVAVRVEGDRATVDVTDAGIGIPASELSQLFTPFFRASNASARNFAGLGLGLHLSRSLAEAHGGTLTAVSAVGQGTTFTLTLPCAEGAP